MVFKDPFNKPLDPVVAKAVNYKTPLQTMTAQTAAAAKAPAPKPAPVNPGGQGIQSFMRNLPSAIKAIPVTPPVAPPVAPPPALTAPQAQAAMVPGLDNRALDALHGYALSDGPSPWLKLATEKQQADEATQLDRTAQQSAGAQAQAMDSIAMRGGLRGGSAENLARQSMENTLLGQQGVRAQGATQRLGLGMDDENRKMDILKGLPGQNLGIWQQGMAAKGASEMADAIRAQGGGGGPTGFGDPTQNAVNKLPSGPVKETGSAWNKMTTFNPVLDPTGGLISGSNAIKTLKTPSWLGG